MLTPTLSTPSSSGDTAANPQTSSTRRRGLSYLRSLSSYSHSGGSSTNNNNNTSADPPRISPRHFFARSTSYQESRSDSTPSGRRRSQSHSRPYVRSEAGLPLTQVRTVDASGAVERQIARQPAAATATATAAAAAATPLAPASQQTNQEQSQPEESRVVPVSEEQSDAMVRSPRESRGSGGRVEDGSDGSAANRVVSGTADATAAAESKQGPPTIRFYPHQDHNRLGRQSLNFSPVSRILPSESSIIRVGRYSEREGPPTLNPNTPSDAPVGFKSKVVSRRHCEFSFADGQWQVRDVASSSGTFLNHIRLSQPNQESRLYPIKDGDIIQLGIDFRGGEEMIFRCVKIRIECNRSWQKKPNAFNKSRHALLRGLSKDQPSSSTNDGECTICLVNCLPCQALFVAPCAHTWHYKCIRPMLEGKNSNYHQFQCPNCRAYADLDADVDVDMSEWQEDPADQDIDLNIDQTDRPDLPAAQQNGSDQDGLVSESMSRENDATIMLSPPSQPLEERNTSSLLSRRQQQQVSTSPDGLSPPLTSIPMPARPSATEMAEHLAQQRTSTGSPNADQIIAGEGPLTPRNNAGPFVFDGSGSRLGSRRQANGPVVGNLGEISSGVD